MIRQSGHLGWGVRLASVALGAAVWGAPSLGDAGTWPAEEMRAPRIAPSQRTYFEAGGLRVPVEDFPIRMVHLGEPPPGMTQAQVDAAARAATESWSQTPCSFARMDYAGQRHSIDELGPNEIPFMFTEPGGAGCLPTGSIGWTALTCGSDFPMNSVFLNVAEFVWADKAQPFDMPDADPTSEKLTVELRSVLVHEFGHVLGLLHTDDPLATMAPTYRPDGGQRSLAVDDKLGLCALYPATNPVDECRSGRDCEPQQRCDHVHLQSLHGVETDQRIALCRELRGAVGDACAPDRLICEEECVFAAQPKDYGYCTVSCEAGGCPSDYECSEGLLRPGESHCRQPRQVERSSCSSAPGAPPSPWTVWLCGAAGALWLSKRRFSRPSRTR